MDINARKELITESFGDSQKLKDLFNSWKSDKTFDVKDLKDLKKHVKWCNRFVLGTARPDKKKSFTRF